MISPASPGFTAVILIAGSACRKQTTSGIPMPSPPGKSSRSPARRKILAPVLLGTAVSCGICALLSWKEYIYPEEPPFILSLSWWLQADLGAGAGLFLMTAVICFAAFMIMNRKRMK
jgi:hypothetical protein